LSQVQRQKQKRSLCRTLVTLPIFVHIAAASRQQLSTYIALQQNDLRRQK